MPPFPGMGYPLVPGYESVGAVVERRAGLGLRGRRARLRSRRALLRRCAAVRRRGLPARRPGRARHADRRARSASRASAGAGRDRLSRAQGVAPGGRRSDRRPRRARPPARAARRAVRRRAARRLGNEPEPRRRAPTATRRRSRTTIRGATIARSTTSAAIDACSTCLIARLAPGGEIVLAGFYDTPLSFAFPPAFMREARIRIAAEWRARRSGRGAGD